MRAAVDGPIDPDSPAAAGPALRPRRWPHIDVVTVVGIGGALGALARYGLDGAFPVGRERFPWTTLGINIGGCLALGIVLYVVFERRPPSRLLRPFLAVGVLGGFTTFSTFAVEVVQRAQSRPAVVAAYVTSSLVAGPVAVLVGGAAIRWVYARPRTGGSTS